MPYTTQWLVEQRIIKTRISQDMTPNTKEAKDILINQLFEESERQNTHVVLDCNELHLPNFRHWRWIRNVHLGWVVVYGINNPLMKLAASIGLQALGVRFQLVDSAEEALVFLQEVDITLPKAQAV